MDPEDILFKIDALAAEFKEQPGKELALKLELLLSRFKLLAGVGVFDQLYAYCRLENQVEKYLNSLDAAETEKFIDSIKVGSLEEIVG